MRKDDDLTECLVIWSLNRPEPSRPQRPVIGVALFIYLSNFLSFLLVPFFHIYRYIYIYVFPLSLRLALVTGFTFLGRFTSE